MKRIRQLYFQHTAVTTVFIEKCTWASTIVGRKIKAALKNPYNGYPNGLVAIKIREAKNVRFTKQNLIDNPGDRFSTNITCI